VEDNLPEKFLKPYNPKETEDNIYKLWEESGFFNPDVCIEKGVTDEGAETFSMVLPPPNVTGTLHVGHAVMVAIEDIVVRFNRMQGKRTLWVPGTDHAAIATQSKVEKEIYKKEKKNRHDLGREEFLKQVETFAQESHDTIVSQIKKMGASVDWGREAFTLDEARGIAVKTAFKKMHDAGLIYQGNRNVNWDPKMQTTVSDDEIEYEDEVTNFYYLTYGPFTIATSRPETKFGDKYVVVHPSDARYKDFTHGQELQLEWINGPITATVIKDEVIDQELGTGAMTITPWHSAVDFDIAQKHKLDMEQIIDSYGKLMPIAGEFAEMKIKDARDKIVEKLQQKGLVKKIDSNYHHRVAKNSRGGGMIEPQVMKQWFVDVKKEFVLPKSNIDGIKSGSTTTLKEIMKRAVESGQVDILPPRFTKIYYHWILNLRDWCISRQLWYGHRIPVWYKEKEIYVGIDAPQGDGWEQDPDTLDTWFSSGLWTFSTLGWPAYAETASRGLPGPENDFANYHPTNLLETGYDIIFFWVARMILMSGFLLGDIPFSTIYLHGLVRDEKGQKMSKSLGNVVDPLEFVDVYGADALRMALVVGIGPGNDNNLSTEKVKAYKKFGNKLWNVARFVLSNLPENFDPNKKPELSKKDAEYIKEIEALASEITTLMKEYKLYLAGEKLYHYVWHMFADVIIEELKERIQKKEDAESAQWTLWKLLSSSLLLLHPFMPFITEEIWSHVPGRSGFLMTEQWNIIFENELQ